MDNLETNAIELSGLNKIYKSGHIALNKVNLSIKKGEIFALLGPNGAGKTTLISIICSIVNASSGSICVGGFDLYKKPRQARKEIGLVPQELALSMFETVWDTVTFSRGLYGRTPNPDYIEKLLRQFSLWEKKDQPVMTLSGGMKRRVLIAKALSHEPTILFLDEPTAGVDVELRQDMWSIIRDLRERGVTVVLTTHYIEEAEEMADRIGVINKGEIILVDETHNLLSRLGKKQLQIHLNEPMSELADELKKLGVCLDEEGKVLTYQYDSHQTQNYIPDILRCLDQNNISFTDLQTEQSSLEDIFVGLVGGEK